MKAARATLFALSLALLTCGYAASQVAYFSDPAAYAARVDAPAARAAANLLLLACVVLPFVGGRPARGEGEEPKR